MVRKCCHFEKWVLASPGKRAICTGITGPESQTRGDAQEEAQWRLCITKISWYTLFAVVTFSKVTEPLLLGGNRGLGSWGSLATMYPSTNQYRTLFYVCFCFKDNPFNMYCWFAHIELRANSPGSHAWTKIFLTHIFKAHHILPALRKHFSTTLGAILNSEITNEKQQNVGTKQTAKGALVPSTRTRTRWQSMALLSLS